MELLARKAVYASDPDFRKSRAKAAAIWKKNNKSRVRISSQKAYHKPGAREKRVAAYKKRYSQRKSYINALSAAYYRRTKAASPWKLSLGSARHRAKKAGIPFDLTNEWAEARWTGQCEATGIPFEMGRKNVGMLSPTLDRLDPQKGYTKGNCWFIIWGLNAWKTNGAWREVVMIAHALASRFTEDGLPVAGLTIRSPLLISNRPPQEEAAE